MKVQPITQKCKKNGYGLKDQLKGTEGHQIKPEFKADERPNLK